MSILKALHDEGYLGDIAIDDVSIIQNFTCQIPTTTTAIVPAIASTTTTVPSTVSPTVPITASTTVMLSTTTPHKEPLETSKSSTRAPTTQTTPIITAPAPGNIF